MFWVYDTVHDVFMKFLIDAAVAHDPPGDSSWLAEEIGSWREVACIGDVSIDLNENWTGTQRQTICSLVEDACVALLSRNSIPADEISQWPIHEEMRIEPRGEQDVSAKALIRFGWALIQLLSGTLPEAPEGTAWFFGTGDVPETIKMLRVQRSVR